MKLKIYCLLLIVIPLFFVSCQKGKVIKQYILTLQPNADDGIDALIFSLDPDGNRGVCSELSAIAWTNGGTPVLVRSLFKFDLTAIPNEAVVDSAKLSLYSYNALGNGSHSTLSGSNECYIQRIASNWNELAVTWNNQPSTSTVNQVILPESINETQDYLDINVTMLVKDQIQISKPNYGFMFKLVTEEYYRQMIFGASDNPDESLHPKLVVFYSVEE